MTGSSPWRLQTRLPGQRSGHRLLLLLFVFLEPAERLAVILLPEVVMVATTATVEKEPAGAGGGVVVESGQVAGGVGGGAGARGRGQGAHLGQEKEQDQEFSQWQGSPQEAVGDGRGTSSADVPHSPHSLHSPPLW